MNAAHRVQHGSALEQSGRVFPAEPHRLHRRRVLPTQRCPRRPRSPRGPRTGSASTQRVEPGVRAGHAADVRGAQRYRARLRRQRVRRDRYRFRWEISILSMLTEYNILSRVASLLSREPSQ